MEENKILIREDYLKQIRPFYDADLIKVIVGVRRAGKSVLLENIKSELLARGIRQDHMICINLEDYDFIHIQTAKDLDLEIKNRIVDQDRYYLFLDEIQRVTDFERALASFRAVLNVSIFVTGSNSTLLSGELATLLTGRAIEFEVYPFSFFEAKEWLELNHRPFNEDMIYDYIKWGGFPVRFQYTDESAIRKYLEQLSLGITNIDLIPKTSKINRASFLKVESYIMANAGKEFSAESIVRYCKSNNNEELSVRTINSYISKMEKAFLIHPVDRYNISGKEILKSRKKYYAVDTGLRTIQTNSIEYEDTFFLENIVYNELCQQGFKVFVGKTYRAEVDFVAVKNGKKCFIQVSYLLASKETIAREFGAYQSVHDASPKYVLSLDRLDMSRDGITHMNLVDFLLHRKELMIS
ncbi:MAG: ATP-binding protein [Solobacterium sp.]|jgi:predicted AAA+ superfamily ATPase|nr:ATP-binding protein [Solobacterium sp.]MCH4222668.1 ATP-binding protein [Solobacterium sp.]MCH4265810.1 ATP-binding protein [Solobacterium sp.]